MADLRKFLAESGNQSLLNQIQATPGGFERAQEEFNQTGSLPSFGLGPGAGISGGTAEDFLRKRQQEVEKAIREQTDFLSDFLESNPFAFDEAMAREASTAKFRPFFEEQLTDFVEPLKEKIKQSAEDETRILAEMVRRRELGETTKLRQIQTGLDLTRGGFAGRGLFTSGGARRAEALQKIGGREELEDFLKRAEETETGFRLGEERFRTEKEIEIGKEERDIFGKGRRFATAVSQDIETRRQTALQKARIRGEEAFRSRFGTPFVGETGQRAESFFNFA